MTMLEDFTRNIKNVFVGSHKGEDISSEWSHPHDSMPIANGSNKYAPPEKMIELEQNPRPEEDAADDWFESDGLEYKKEEPQGRLRMKKKKEYIKLELN